jgi:hypothetical protein
MTLKNRLAKLEAAKVTKRAPRMIVRNAEGEYSEGGKVITEAEYPALASDPVNDVTLIVVRYASEAQPVSTLTNGDYSFTVGIDLTEI